MDLAKLLCSLFLVWGMVLTVPINARAQNTTNTATGASSTANTSNPFQGTQGTLAQYLVGGLLGASKELHTPGFNPILNLALSGLIYSTFGPNAHPVFLQNADFGGFVSGLATKSPEEIRQLFTRGLRNQITSTGNTESAPSTTQTNSDTNIYNATFTNGAGSPR